MYNVDIPTQKLFKNDTMYFIFIDMALKFVQFLRGMNI